MPARALGTLITHGSAFGEQANTKAAFVGEIDLTLGYRLTQHIIVRGGYQLLWIDNVALAGDAASRGLLNPSVLRGVEFNSLFYQGATTGIDFVW
ncbi:MAG: BBP7 family outer membrane beta-barrel protein [Planctomycetaceae bacterium]|nr:BBP7 family outer membrane beta-barrel protein [Planctomycetaceae bacterium]